MLHIPSSGKILESRPALSILGLELAVRPRKGSAAVCSRCDLSAGDALGHRANEKDRPLAVEGLNNKAKVTMRKSYGFRKSATSNLRSVTHLANCPSRNQPTEFF